MAHASTDSIFLHLPLPLKISDLCFHSSGATTFSWATEGIVGNSSLKPHPQSLNGRFAHDSARSSRHMPSDDGQILRNLQSHPMTAADFRRIALGLGVE